MPSRRKNYEEDLLRAVAEIKNGQITYCVASTKYGIPLATLCDKVTNRFPVSTKMGKMSEYYIPIYNYIQPL